MKAVMDDNGWGFETDINGGTRLELTWTCFKCGHKHVIKKGLLGFQIRDGFVEYTGQCEKCHEVVEIVI